MTNVEKYVEHVKHIQQFEDRWSSERQSHEHDVRRELRAKLTFEEVEEANKLLGWPVPVRGEE